MSSPNSQWSGSWSAASWDPHWEQVEWAQDFPEDSRHQGKGYSWAYSQQALTEAARQHAHTGKGKGSGIDPANIDQGTPPPSAQPLHTTEHDRIRAAMAQVLKVEAMLRNCEGFNKRGSATLSMWFCVPCAARGVVSKYRNTGGTATTVCHECRSTRDFSVSLMEGYGTPFISLARESFVQAPTDGYNKVLKHPADQVLAWIYQHTGVKWHIDCYNDGRLTNGKLPRRELRYKRNPSAQSAFTYMEMVHYTPPENMFDLLALHEPRDTADENDISEPLNMYYHHDVKSDGNYLRAKEEHLARIGRTGTTSTPTPTRQQGPGGSVAAGTGRMPGSSGDAAPGTAAPQKAASPAGADGSATQAAPPYKAPPPHLQEAVQGNPAQTGGTVAMGVHTAELASPPARRSGTGAVTETPPNRAHYKPPPMEQPRTTAPLAQLAQVNSWGGQPATGTAPDPARREAPRDSQPPQATGTPIRTATSASPAIPITGTGNSPEYLELPVGYTRYYCHEQKRFYYHNTANNESKWTRPPPPQPQEVIDAINHCGQAVVAFNKALTELGQQAPNQRTVSESLHLHNDVADKLRRLEATIVHWRTVDLREAARRAELIP